MVKFQSGYIAITSVMILAILLMLVTVGLSSTTFFARLNLLDTEFKAQSLELAASCVNMALLRLHQQAEYGGDERVYLTKTDFCQIGQVANEGANKIIKTEGVYQNAYTNLEVKVNPGSNYALVSWREQ